MKKIPDFELLRDAYMIIDGVPENRFDLNDLISVMGEDLASETVACAAGWLSFHPQFQSRGLMRSGNHIAIKGLDEATSTYHAVLGKIFGLTDLEAKNIFATRKNSKYDTNILSDRGAAISDKDLWLSRVVAFLNERDPKVPS